MTTFVLPTRLNLPNYDTEVDLDEVVFRIRLKFNSRDEAWYLSIFDSNGVELRSGIKVVSDWPLTRLLADTNVRPAGEILAVNRIGDGVLAKPGLEQLGVDTVLVYDGGS